MFLKKIWEELRKALAVILVIVAVVLFVMSIYTAGAPAATGTFLGMTSIQQMALAVVALMLAFLAHFEAAMKFLEKVFNFVWYVFEKAAEVAASVAGTAISTLWNSLPTILKVGIFAVGGVWIYSKISSDSENTTVNIQESPNV
jgi:hypothetical protein